MTRATDGIASSIFHLFQALQVLADDFDDKNRQLSFLSHMYIKVLLTRGADLESASQLQDTVISTVGFDNRNCTSNNPVLFELPANFQKASKKMTFKSEDNSIKTFWGLNGRQIWITSVI